MPTPNKPPTVLTPAADEKIVVQAQPVTLDDTAERPAARVGHLMAVSGSGPLPSLLVPVRAVSPEQWAAEKSTPDWLLAAARARHLQPGTDGRAAWLENGVLTEEAFDLAIDTTANGSLR